MCFGGSKKGASGVLSNVFYVYEFIKKQITTKCVLQWQVPETLYLQFF